MSYRSGEVRGTLVEAPAINLLPRALSWSWASGDGPISCLKVSPSFEQKLRLHHLEVIMERWEDDITESQPVGKLKIRGPLAEMVNQPPTRGDRTDVGRLAYAKQILVGRVMDTKRDVRRACYALLIYECRVKASFIRYFLVPKEVGIGAPFKRVGVCPITGMRGDIEGFAATNTIII